MELKAKNQLPWMAPVNMSNCFIHMVCRDGATASVLTAEKRITVPPAPRPLHLSRLVTLQHRSKIYGTAFFWSNLCIHAKLGVTRHENN